MIQRQFPVTVTPLVVASVDTNPIPVVTAQAGLIVKVWGFILTGGTGFTVKDGTTALSGVIATAQPIVAPHQLHAELPGRHVALFESTIGGTVNIVPAAAGLNGVVWWSQDAG